MTDVFIPLSGTISSTSETDLFIPLSGSLSGVAAADTTPPVLTLPTGVQTGSTTASGTVTTDEGNGTLFYLATINATETAATIKAGSSQAVSATGIQNVTVIGLTPSTIYFLHYVHDDAAANESNVVTSASFTTDAAVPSVDTLDSPVVDASVGNAFTVSGFAGPITKVDIINNTFTWLDTMLNLAGSYTYEVTDVASYLIITAGVPFDSATHSNFLVPTDGTSSASAAIVRNPKAGFAVVEVLGAIGGAGSVFDGFTTLPVDTDQTYYPTANGVSVAPDGTLTPGSATGTINMWWFDTLTGAWKPFTVIITAGGIVPNPYYLKLMAGM